MRLKFEKNRINCKVSQIEAVELLKLGFLADQVNFPSGHIFTFRVELSDLSEDSVQYFNSTLTFQMTNTSVERLLQEPTKRGITFLQDKAVYVFEVDIRDERRRNIRKI